MSSSLLSVARASCSCFRSAGASTSAFALAPLLAGARAIHAPASSPTERRVPTPRGDITDVPSLFAASKRKLTQYDSKVGDWAELFTKTGAELRDAGMTAKERRYTMWLLERYRQGHDIHEVAVPLPPKKKIRGWGPKVQFGKRIR